MLFSVIIPTCNRLAILKLCLTAVYFAENNFTRRQVEIIVTDDSIDDSLIDILKTDFPEVIFLKGPRKGPAANRNNGAISATGQWLLFLDDDIIPDENIFSAYANAISLNLETSAFEGAIFPDNWDLLKKDMAECPVNVFGGCFWSANICVKKDLFTKVGGFDEQYTIAAQEDQDLYKKIKEYTQVPFLKNAFVTHPVRIASLKNKIHLATISITNWLKFEIKTKSLSHCIYLGYKTQFLAFIDNIKKMKIKSSFYNIYVILIFPLVLMIAKINRNV